MADFAIIKDNKVINVIVANNKETAEEITGLEALETDGSFWTGWTRVGNIWVEPVIIEEVSDTIV